MGVLNTAFSGIRRWRRSRSVTYVLLTIFTAATGLLIASVFLLFGVAHLINPDVPESYLAQNTLMCLTVILTGMVIVYALFRPYSGGFLLALCAVAISIVSQRFFQNPLTTPVLMLGVLCFVRSYLLQRQYSQRRTSTPRE